MKPLFNLNTRYTYKGRADRLHYFYDGSWAGSLEECYPENYSWLIAYFEDKGYDTEHIRLAVKKWVKLCDPSCYTAGSAYQAIQNLKLTKELLGVIQQMSLPGLMTEIIEFAKAKPNAKHFPKDKLRFSRWVSLFIYPFSEHYHEMFAKDLYNIAPQLCVAELTKVEQQELLEIYMKKNKCLPKRQDDAWVIPVDSRWAKFKGSFNTGPYWTWKRYGKEDQTKFFVEVSIKQGNRPEQWDNIKKMFPDYANEVENKYPDIFVKKIDWYRNNLTNPQQKQLEGWTKVEALVSTDESDDELLARLSREERMLVGNYFKQLDATRSHKNQKKINEFIVPIVNRLKQKRPALYQLYTSKKDNTTNRLYDITGPGAKNEETMEQFYILAKNGADRPTNALASSLAKLAGKNTRYPEFAEEIRRLRPDWFDKKAIRKDIMDRFHKRGKYKETV